jgi:hypothetical protein
MTPDRTTRELLDDLASDQQRVGLTDAYSEAQLIGQPAESWRAAEADAQAAYEAWRRSPGPDAYLVYCAAEERAHAAEEALGRWMRARNTWTRAAEAVAVPA